MFAMKMHSMNTSADAWYAPACQRCCHNNIVILDTVVAAVSVLILGLVTLVNIVVRIMLTIGQSGT